ncbi:MAG: hypothetical protein IKP71_01595, partial [Candidatus Riflebacteria bacterium]|nr:hypothetical protein [Candidatus Riflebacteria bacterium]
KSLKNLNCQEEAKNVIANAGMELTDDELDNVVGGSNPIIEDPITRLNKEKEAKEGLNELITNNIDNPMAPRVFNERLG